MKKITIVMVVLLMVLVGCNENPGITNPQSSSTINSSYTWNFPEDAGWNYEIDTQDYVPTRSVKIDTFFSGGIMSYFSARAHLPLSRPNAMYSSASVNGISPIECAREKENDDNYIVYNIEEGGKYYCFFPADQGHYLSHSIWVKEPIKAEDFGQLQVGNSFAEVLAVDPALSYAYDKGYNCNAVITRDNLWIYRFTLHLLDDGLLVIRYNNIDAKEKGQELIGLDSYIIDIQKYEDFKFPVSLGTMVDGIYDYSVLQQDMIG